MVIGPIVVIAVSDLEDGGSFNCVFIVADEVVVL